MTAAHAVLVSRKLVQRTRREVSSTELHDGEAFSKTQVWLAGVSEVVGQQRIEIFSGGATGLPHAYSLGQGQCDAPREVH